MTSYELKTEKFSGPIEKLLELIEAKQLEITELSLAEVTGDFLNYLRTVEKSEPRLLADFVVVASRLLLIKSKALLPSLEISEEEEAEIKDLEERLKLYREFKLASQHIKALWSDQPGILTREFLLAAPSFFYPPPDLAMAQIHQAITRLLAEFGQFFLETKNLKIAIVSLEEKMKELLERVKSSAFKFKELAGGRSRAEIIALFLAILHLLKSELIRVEQQEHFSEINISGMTNDQ